jgi:hypothetical protein
VLRAPNDCPKFLAAFIAIKLWLMTKDMVRFLLEMVSGFLALAKG